MEKIYARADILVELSWEVCNKVGGIYTVIQSKAALMHQYYNDYFLIGPYFKDRAEFELEEHLPPYELAQVFEKLKAEGIICYYGSWQIKGEPKVILIDYRGLTERKNEFKEWLWLEHGIDSIRAGWDFEEPIIWSFACARLLEELSRSAWQGKRIVSHHHEWLAGISLLFLKKRQPLIRSVFTTHATMLGRSVASHNEDLYSLLGSFDPSKKAYEVGVQEKFLTEKACAKEATVFTTVSEITGLEAEHLLGRKPDVLVLNGFDTERFPTIEETSIKHVTAREILREFQTFHFFPYYHNFNLDENLMFCISGRYEFGNKGMDVFVDALGKLNKKLQDENAERTVTVFFWLLRDNMGVKSEVLENRNYYRHIKSYVKWHSGTILKEITRDFIISEDPSKDSFYSKEFLHEMKKDVLHFKRQGDPPLVTHSFFGEYDDALLKKLHGVGLDNKSDDKVKIIVSPCFLDGNDGVLDLSYYDALAGTHFAIFPSSYEPWGYTPLEAAAMGVPTVTTDLAGFGRFIKPQLLPQHSGIYVLDRFKKSHDQIVDGLFKILVEYVSLDHTERVQHKINAKQLSKLADWRHMIKNYIKAHNLALEDVPSSD
jgi:glycogen(starch) synthase